MSDLLAGLFMAYVLWALFSIFCVMIPLAALQGAYDAFCYLKERWK